MSLMRTTRLYATEELWSIGQEITRELSRRYITTKNCNCGEPRKK